MGHAVNVISSLVELWKWVNLSEVERVFGANHPDPVEMEKAIKLLKEHELALTDVIAKLADMSEDESGSVVAGHCCAREPYQRPDGRETLLCKRAVSETRWEGDTAVQESRNSIL